MWTLSFFFTDYIRNTIRNLGDCETASRYYDFFALISSIMRVGPWDECRVEQLLESFTEMVSQLTKLFVFAI